MKKIRQLKLEVWTYTLINFAFFVANFIGEFTVVALLGVAVYLETNKSRALERARKEALELEVEKLGKELNELRELVKPNLSPLKKNS